MFDSIDHAAVWFKTWWASERGEVKVDAEVVQDICEELRLEVEAETIFTGQRPSPSLTVGSHLHVDHRMLDLFEALVARQLMCHSAVRKPTL